MKTYSLKKAIAAALVALAAAAFAAAATDRLLSRGSFLTLDLGLSRYGRIQGGLPALLVFLAVLILLTALLVHAYAQKATLSSWPQVSTIITTPKNSAPAASTCGWSRTRRPS